MFTHKEEDISKSELDRRMFILLAGQSLLFATLAGRLYKLQVLDTEKFTLQAEENRINVSVLQPERGRIFDKNGYYLATNIQNLQLYIIPEQTQSVHDTLKKLQKIITLSNEKIAYLLEKNKTMANFEKLRVADNMSWNDFSKMGFYSPKLPGVHLFSGVTRTYPFGSSLAHVVGYTAKPNSQEAGQDILLKQNDFQIGKIGTEKTHEDVLRGKMGQKQYEINAHGRVVRELSKTHAQSGQDIVITIDARLQNFIFKRFNNQSGAAVVIDVKNGDIVAMVSAPSYDPKSFTKGISRNEWRKLTNDPYKPLLAKAHAGLYPPGSVFKMVVALAAMQYKNWDPETIVNCPGYYRMGGRLMRCWKREGHGRLDLTYALKKSCDVYFYTMAQKIGIETIAEMGYEMGLSTAYENIGFNNIKKGILPTPQWKKETFGKVWYPGETVIAGIGQGFVTTTPLELAMMTARIAAGKKIMPRLLTSVGNAGPYGREDISHFKKQPRKGFEELPINDEYMKIVRDGMWSVVNEWGGTAYRSRLGLSDFEMVGKTGTAQVIKIQEGTEELSQDEIKREHRDHALFVAYAPYHDPRYALSIIVEHGKSGSKTAAPIAKDIMQYIYNTNRE